MTSARYWGIVPAAGIGARMSAGIPKQYLPFNNSSILESTLARLLQFSRFEKILVAINPLDSHWRETAMSKSRHIETVAGGSERYHSVLFCLRALEERADVNDWVVVHDAVRPCVRVADIAALCHALADHPVGGILAVPVSDTLKRVDEKKEIVGTIERQELWQAQTPQVFRFGLLLQALENALASNTIITDDAAAIEHLGYKALVVAGNPDNIKITRQHDLALAQIILHGQAIPPITSTHNEDNV